MVMLTIEIKVSKATPQIEDLILALIKAGEEEGFLRPRPNSELLAILPYFFAALTGKKVVAIGALAPYINCSEVVCFYLTPELRGQGLAEKLLHEMKARPDDEYIFACTVSPSAKEFFLKNGFEEVGYGDVPEEKWNGYPDDREPWVLKKPKKED